MYRLRFFVCGIFPFTKYISSETKDIIDFYSQEKTQTFLDSIMLNPIKLNKDEMAGLFLLQKWPDKRYLKLIFDILPKPQQEKYWKELELSYKEWNQSSYLFKRYNWIFQGKDFHFAQFYNRMNDYEKRIFVSYQGKEEYVNNFYFVWKSSIDREKIHFMDIWLAFYQLKIIDHNYNIFLKSGLCE